MILRESIRAKSAKTSLRRSSDEISAYEIVREFFLQLRSPNTTTRSLSSVTGVGPVAFRRMCDACEEYDGMGEETGRGRGTHVREAEREKTDTE